MSIYLPNEILNIIFSYREKHIILQKTSMIHLMDRYNKWNKPDCKHYCSFQRFVNTFCGDHTQKIKKQSLKDFISETLHELNKKSIII